MNRAGKALFADESNTWYVCFWVWKGNVSVRPSIFAFDTLAPRASVTNADGQCTDSAVRRSRQTWYVPYWNATPELLNIVEPNSQTATSAPAAGSSACPITCWCTTTSTPRYCCCVPTA